MKALALILMMALPTPTTRDAFSARQPELASVPAARVAYAALRPLAAGCTPILQKFANGSLAVVGCPTNNCPGSSCQWDGSDSEEIMSCYCIDGARPLCKGVVTLDAFGLPTDWTCIRMACANACTRINEPPAPPAGTTDFYVCDC